uniref:Uncharacterized protein n=1 Tax=Arundo donax TaxID=35708 RepID=A0A0A9GYQ4_ARUDO
MLVVEALLLALSSILMTDCFSSLRPTITFDPTLDVVSFLLVVLSWSDSDICPSVP